MCVGSEQEVEEGNYEAPWSRKHGNLRPKTFFSLNTCIEWAGRTVFMSGGNRTDTKLRLNNAEEAGHSFPVWLTADVKSCEETRLHRDDLIQSEVRSFISMEPSKRDEEVLINCPVKLVVWNYFHPVLKRLPLPLPSITSWQPHHVFHKTNPTFVFHSSK